MMTARRRNRALTLLEVVLAASIMAAVVALILTGYSRMAAASALASQYGQAADLLNLKLQEVYSVEDLSAIDLDGEFADTDVPGVTLASASWRIEVTSRKTGLSEIAVTVSWLGPRGVETVTASTLRFLPGEIGAK